MNTDGRHSTWGQENWAEKDWRTKISPTRGKEKVSSRWKVENEMSYNVTLKHVII